MTIGTKCGPTTGGTSVEICGGPWDEETLMFTTVMFGDDAATRVDPGQEHKTTTDDYKSYKSIIATSPPHEEGSVSITVITPDGSKKETDAFTYVFEISDVYPPKATVPKDEIVVVAIMGKDLANVAHVKFGDNFAPRFGWIDPTHIWAVVPYSEKTGKVPVQVKTPHGENKDTPTFEYDKT